MSTKYFVSSVSWRLEQVDILNLKCYTNFNMNASFPNLPPRENFELQAVYLRQLQQNISRDLFESGVASRLLAGDSNHGANFPLHGVDQLELVFTPCLSKRIDGDKTEEVLSLAVIKEDNVDSDGKPFSRTYAYRGVGIIDSAGVLMKYPDVDADDADAVYVAARQLSLAREEGELPNLSFSLLSINNPNTSIQAAPR